MKDRLLKIGEAAKMLGTSVGTMRSWEASGELMPAINILKQGEDTFKPTSKRTSESCKPSGYRSKDVDGVNKIIADSLDSDILL